MVTKGWVQRIVVLALVAVVAAVAASYLLWGPSPTTAVAAAATADGPGLSGAVVGHACLEQQGFCYQAPVPHVFVVVTATGFYRQAETDSVGSFQMALKPGDYFVSVSDGHGHHLGETVPLTLPASGRLHIVVDAG
jgi:hypothetical protein